MKSGMRRAFVALIGLPASLFLAGCILLNPGNTGRVQPVSGKPRVGQVIVIRGLIGIWSLGMDGLGRMANDNGVQGTVFQDDQWSIIAMHIRHAYKGVKNPEPLVIVGHSYGADNAIRIARALTADNIKVDLLVTIEPVTPPRVPRNVVTAVDYYQSRGITDNLPWWRGIPLTPDDGFKGAIFNYNLTTDRRDLLVPHLEHASMSRDKKILAEIVQWLLKVCPPRTPQTPLISKPLQASPTP